MTADQKIASLKKEIEHLKHCLTVLIIWMGKSANSPLSLSECGDLIKLISEGKRE